MRGRPYEYDPQSTITGKDLTNGLTYKNSTVVDGVRVLNIGAELDFSQALKQSNFSNDDAITTEA